MNRATVQVRRTRSLWKYLRGSSAVVTITVSEGWDRSWSASGRTTEDAWRGVRVAARVFSGVALAAHSPWNSRHMTPLVPAVQDWEPHDTVPARDRH